MEEEEKEHEPEQDLADKQLEELLKADWLSEDPLADEAGAAEGAAEAGAGWPIASQAATATRRTLGEAARPTSAAAAATTATRMRAKKRLI